MPGAAVALDPVRESLVSSAGGLLLTRTVKVSGVGRSLSAALAPWRGPRAQHDPGQILLDLAIAVALGGDCLADIGVVRAQPALFGRVASDATVSRTIAALAGDAQVVVAAVRAARAAARAKVWALARPLQPSMQALTDAPASGPSAESGIRANRGASRPMVIVDLDSTLVGAHSDKEGASATFKRTFGFSPMCAFVDHGEHGTGEPLVLQLREGRSSPWDKDDHIAALDAALAQLPVGERARVLVRADSGACSKAFLTRVADLGLDFSVGFPAHETVKDAIAALPAQAWRAALDGDGQPREGAQVAELTTWMRDPVRATRPGVQDWPPGMRVIARRELPHPGAQLRLTDIDGWRVTCFATNTRGTGWTLPVLEVRHRQRARAEDRIRALKDTGLRNLPLHAFAANQIWLEIVSLAAELLAWTQTLAFEPHAPARRWEPKRLRLRLLAVAGRIIRSGRRQRLRLPRDWPWNDLLDTAWARLQTLRTLQTT